MSSDIAPVMTGATVVSNPNATSARRKIPTSVDRSKRRRPVDDIKEDRDGHVIPSDAEDLQSFDMQDYGMELEKPALPDRKIKNPYSGDEPLIQPSASLVAPDITPEAVQMIDPSQLPGADRGSAPTSGYSSQPAGQSPTLDLLTGHQPNQGGGQMSYREPMMSAESALSRLPGIPAPGADIAPTGQPTLNPNQPMPDHVPNDGGKSILETFSRFVPRSKPTYQ